MTPREALLHRIPSRLVAARSLARDQQVSSELRRRIYGVVLWAISERLRFRQVLTRLYRADMRGTEHVPPVGPCILVANHESLFDPRAGHRSQQATVSGTVAPPG